jgi:ATP synthase protein I
VTERDQNNDVADGLKRSVRLRRERRERAKHEGERSLAQNLAWMGTLGWLIIVPTLLGMFLGRWIDRHFGLGVTFSSTLCCVGLGLGCWLAWRRIRPS